VSVTWVRCTSSLNVPLPVYSGLSTPCERSHTL